MNGPRSNNSIFLNIAPVVIFCRSGRRAGKAKTILEERGYKTVLNAGGLGDINSLFWFFSRIEFVGSLAINIAWKISLGTVLCKIEKLDIESNNYIVKNEIQVDNICLTHAE